MLNAKYKFEMYEKRPRNARGAFCVSFKSREAKVNEREGRERDGRQRMKERKTAESWKKARM